MGVRGNFFKVTEIQTGIEDGSDEPLAWSSLLRTRRIASGARNNGSSVRKKSVSFFREINNRAKNMLSVVDAIAHQMATRNAEDFIDRFSAYSSPVGQSGPALVRNQWRGVEVEHLVRAQLAHFADRIGSRIVMDGVPLLSVCPCQIPVD
jgi:hypothetical protein